MLDNPFFTPTPKHTFVGQWITTAELAALPVQNVFHRQLDKAARAAIRTDVQNRHVLFRRSFFLKAKPEKAVLFFSADDYAKVYINGKLAGMGPGAGYPSHALYLAVDVTNLLRRGHNVLAVHSYYQGLINRVWTSGDNVHGFLCDLVCDGKTVLASGPDFRCRLHSGYSICGKVGYDTQFMEDYDARSPEVGFQERDYDDSDWEGATLANASRWSLFPSPLPPIETESISARGRVLTVTPTGKRVVLFDFGATYVGTFQAPFSGPAGSIVELRFGQELNEDGTVRYEMRCICTYREKLILSGEKGDTPDAFDYKSFRYAEVRCPKGVAYPSKATLLARHMPFRLAQTCAYGERTIRRIWDLAVDSFHYGVQEQIMDCMDREKGYYLGDGVYTMAAWCFLVNDFAPMRKFVDDFLRTSFITPGLVTCANCSFMQEIAEYPLMMFLLLPILVKHDDGAEFVRKRLPKFRALLRTYQRDYARQDGLLQNLDKWCVVEWPRNMRDGYDADVEEGKVCTDLHITINAWYIGAVRLYNRLVRDLGGTAKPFGDEEALLAAFRKVFYNPKTKLFRDREGSDHESFPGNVYPWFFDLQPDEASDRAILRFVKRKGLTAGMLFTTVPLLATLRRKGEEALIKKFLLDPNAWRRMLKEGATTTFEAWGKDVKWNTSLFHLTLASVTLFLMEDPIGTFNETFSCLSGCRKVH